MMVYEDGQEAAVGDVVLGKSSDVAHPIQGVVVMLIEAEAETAVDEVVVHYATRAAVSDAGRASVTIASARGAASDFMKVG
jgi:hypothetical protein